MIRYSKQFINTSKKMLIPKDKWTHPYQEGLPNSLFEENRKKFLGDFRQALGFTREESKTNSIAFFKGLSEVPLYNSDTTYQFYQEGHFYYLFGVSQPDCYGALDLDTGAPTLFVPRQSNLYKVWMTVLSREDYQKEHEIEDVRYAEEMQEWLQKRQAAKVYLNGGVNTDSGIENVIPEEKYWKELSAVDKETMWEVLANCRVTKTQ